MQFCVSNIKFSLMLTCYIFLLNSDIARVPYYIFDKGVFLDLIDAGIKCKTPIATQPLEYDRIILKGYFTRTLVNS